MFTPSILYFRIMKIYFWLTKISVIWYLIVMVKFSEFCVIFLQIKNQCQLLIHKCVTLNWTFGISWIIILKAIVSWWYGKIPKNTIINAERVSEKVKKMWKYLIKTNGKNADFKNELLVTCCGKKLMEIQSFHLRFRIFFFYL